MVVDSGLVALNNCMSTWLMEASLSGTSMMVCNHFGY